jgi:hypothetical protein
VSYQKFAEPLQNFSIEIAIAKDKLDSDKERKLAKIYDAALRILADSSTIRTVSETVRTV